MNFNRRWLWSPMAVVLGIALAACGSSPPKAGKGNITVAGFAFPESSIMAYVYGEALGGAGYTVSYKLNLGTRAVVEPALESRQIDLYPGYTASDLEYQDKNAGLAGGDAATNNAKLNTFLTPKGLEALTPSSALDTNAFAVKKAIAKQYNLKTLSDLARVSNKLVFGAPPDCPTNALCAPGLSRVYGIKFKSTQLLDLDGPATYAALDSGTVQVGEVFSSDATISSHGLVVLTDNKHLEAADDLVPIGRTSVLRGVATTVLNNVSSKLTTSALIAMNAKVAINHADPSQVASAWLKSHDIKT